MIIATNNRFEINEENMRDLAYMADKYIIDSLYNDVHVYELLRALLTK